VCRQSPPRLTRTRAQCCRAGPRPPPPRRLPAPAPPP
jgi:hypothetical protein